MIRALARIVDDAGRATGRRPARDGTPSPARRRPATGLPGGIAIPHCRTAARRRADPRLRPAVPRIDFGAKDGPADLVFLIAAPAGGDATHLQLLTKLARALVKKEFTDALRDATTPEEVADLVSVVRRPPRRGAASPPPGAGRRPGRRCGRARRCTGCPPQPWSPSPPARPASRTPTWPPRPSRPPPSGPASTSQVETQGSAGATPLAPEVIAARRRRDLRRRRRASATGAGSPASRSSPPASSAPSTTPTR